MVMMNQLLSDNLIAEYAALGLWRSETLWDLAKKSNPDRVAVVCPRNGSITYGVLVREAEGLAAAWHARGVSNGDPIILQIPNWYDFVLAHLALTRLGAITLPALPAYRSLELEQIAEAAGAVGVVGAPSFRYCPPADLYDSLRNQVRTLREIWLVDSKDGGIRSLAAKGDPASLPPAPDPRDVTILIATSGTTGRPKLVAHSHTSTLGGVLERIARDIVGLTEDDVILMASPVTHMTGLEYGVRMSTLLGATLVLMDRWDPASAADLIAKYGVTYTQGATPFLFDLVHLPDEYLDRLRSLRTFVCGGAPIPSDLARRALESMPGTALLPTWGMSETAIATLMHPNDPIEKVTGSDGRAVPGWEIRIVSAEGEVLPPGSVGEIECRGAGLFHGYFRRDDLTREAMHNGWLRTGDRGRMDAQGYVRCLDRIKDLIIRGGLNVSPIEIEELMRLHPSVAEVAVVGIPDDRLGERICAVVIARGELPTVETMADFLLGNGLSQQKLPEKIVGFDSFPRTAAGKVQKYVLRKQVLERKTS
jgi:cyclohexanecarboxylate-CoA ligase